MGSLQNEDKGELVILLPEPKGGWPEPEPQAKQEQTFLLGSPMKPTTPPVPTQKAVLRLEYEIPPEATPSSKGTSLRFAEGYAYTDPHVSGVWQLCSFSKSLFCILMTETSG